MTHICMYASRAPISLNNLHGGLILGVNTLYRLFCFFKLFPMVGKGLIEPTLHSSGLSMSINALS